MASGQKSVYANYDLKGMQLTILVVYFCIYVIWCHVAKSDKTQPRRKNCVGFAQDLTVYSEDHPS